MTFQPTRQMIHVDVPLRNLSIKYQQDQTEYVSANVFPSVPVNRQSDRYIVFKKGDWFRTVAAKRAPGTPSIGTKYDIDNTPTYFCDRWSVHHKIPIEHYANADDGLRLEDNGQQIVTRNLLIRRELVFLRQFMRTGIWQGYLPGDFSPIANGSGAWNSSTSNPQLDIDNMKRSIHGQTGWTPNTFVATSDIYFALRNHPALKDVFKYTRPGILDTALLAQVFGIERFFIINAVLNTAQEGQPDVMNYMASNTFLLCYAPPAPSLEAPSAGYTFEWTGLEGSGGTNTTIEKWYEQNIKSWMIEGEMAFDMRSTGLDLGVLGVNVLQ